MSKRTNQIDAALRDLKERGVKFALTFGELEGEEVTKICVRSLDKDLLLTRAGDFLIGEFEEIKIKGSEPVYSITVSDDFAERAKEKGSPEVKSSKFAQEMPHILGLSVEVSARKSGHSSGGPINRASWKK